MQEHMSNVSREMDTLKGYLKEMLKIKTMVTEMKNTFDGLIHRLDTPEERISEFQDVSRNFPK